MNKENQQDAPEVQQQHDGACRTTETPVDLLVAGGVDPAWAKEYVEFEERFEHFSSSLLIWWNVSPRFIRLVVRRPESLIRLIKAKWEKTADKRPGDTSEKNGQYDLTEWYAPRNMTWDINQLEQPIDLYEKGLSPMEALIEIHSDCEDGHEDDEIIIGSPDPLIVIMMLALMAIFTVGALSYFNHVSGAAKAVASL
jgi:hypothetical protein